jgi:hypothetical protein
MTSVSQEIVDLDLSIPEAKIESSTTDNVIYNYLTKKSPSSDNVDNSGVKSNATESTNSNGSLSPGDNMNMNKNLNLTGTNSVEDSEVENSNSASKLPRTSTEDAQCWDCADCRHKNTDGNLDCISCQSWICRDCGNLNNSYSTVCQVDICGSEKPTPEEDATGKRALICIRNYKREQELKNKEEELVKTKSSKESVSKEGNDDIVQTRSDSNVSNGSNQNGTKRMLTLEELVKISNNMVVKPGPFNANGVTPSKSVSFGEVVGNNKSFNGSNVSSSNSASNNDNGLMQRTNSNASSSNSSFGISTLMGGMNLSNSSNVTQYVSGGRRYGNLVKPSNNTLMCSKADDLDNNARRTLMEEARQGDEQLFNTCYVHFHEAGSWHCANPGCRVSNNKSRSECHKCKSKRPNPIEGGWKCPFCKNTNRPNRPVCNMRKCRMPHPFAFKEEIESTTELYEECRMSYDNFVHKQNGGMMMNNRNGNMNNGNGSFNGNGNGSNFGNNFGNMNGNGNNNVDWLDQMRQQNGNNNNNNMNMNNNNNNSFMTAMSGMNGNMNNNMNNNSFMSMGNGSFNNNTPSFNGNNNMMMDNSMNNGGNNMNNNGNS